MSSFIKLGRGGFKEKYLPMQLLPNTKWRFEEPEYMGVQLHSLHIEKLTGKDDTVEGTTLKVGGYYAVHFGLVKPCNYQGLVSLNPELLRTAMVQTANVLNPNNEHVLSIYIQPLKQMDISDYNWLLQLNLID